MRYEFAEGYKIRDQSATHFLTFLLWAGLIFSAGNVTAISSSTVCNIAVLTKRFV